MKLLNEGYPIKQLSRETKIVRSRLYIWRKRYIYYGEEGLRRKAPHHVSESEIASIKADWIGMADMGLKAKIKRVKYRLYKGEIGRVAPNVIARDFKTTGINQNITSSGSQSCYKNG